MALNDHYGTAHLAPAQRFSYWRNVICQTLVPAQGEPEDERPFDARIAVRAFGPVTVSLVSAPAQFWTRGSGDVRREPRDEFLASLVLSGDGCLTQAGREAAQPPGTVLLYDASREFTYRVAAEIVVLKIPRRLLLARAPSAARQTAMPFAGATPVGGVVAGLMQQLARMELPDGSPASAKLGASMLDVLGALFDANGDEAAIEGGRRTPSLEGVQTSMRARLGDPSLDTEAVARANGISPRTLARLFAAAGTTPMRWLWAQRVEMGYCMLAEGWARSVTDVALESGFRDLSHFSRAFKRAYRVLPSHVLLCHKSGRAMQHRS